MQYTINNPISIPLYSTIDLRSLGAVADYYVDNTFNVGTVLPSGTLTLLTGTPVGFTGYLFSLTFTPTISGIYKICMAGIVLPEFEVVSKTSQTILQNLEDESLGSWTWNKTTGVLSLLRQSGSVLATFNAADSLVAASRERVS